MSTLDSNKFSFAQATSNKDGKTSGTGTLGLIGGLIALLCFLIGAIFYAVKGDIMLCTVSGALFTTCATLLGWRKHKESKEEKNSTENSSDKGE